MRNAGGPSWCEQRIAEFKDAAAYLARLGLAVETVDDVAYLPRFRLRGHGSLLFRGEVIEAARERGWRPA